MAKDMGSLMVQQDCDEALSRAYERSDFLSTRRMSVRSVEADIVDEMAERGGSFVRAIAHAARMADERNYERLRDAFSDYWTEYRALAEARRCESIR